MTLSTDILTTPTPAARLLAQGRLVAFPTETVYGLGGNALSDAAVAAIYAAKGRPRFNPLIIHLADIAQISRFAHLTDAAAILAQAFWPGPLTLVLPLAADHGLSPLVTAGLDTVAVRIPDLPLARDLLRLTDLPIAAPSANPSGRVSPTTAQHVLDGLSGKIDAVLDGGPCGVGLESTIVGFDPVPTLLRPGGLPTQAIERALGYPLALPDTGAKITAPGQLTSHYAPLGTVRLNAQSARPGETLLGFGAVKADLNLSPGGDLAQAAANLFRHLRTLDAQGARKIAVSPIPDTGLGQAINDRLRRAAAPRG
ncbi:L-threonylcarbamoyladenylate synthase [Oceaniglobus ichthyenteri]|uniref:L-threonylcarbamoyladenylate synthase n=1 Tax=Oceaniglobus ichthyenteri TaxID=2136177 RepID=UPI000D3C8A66|nr:L-threonylcarbamoyladenylate synthase [Oceaniglobus ichthyenteri]